jgi:hypothetical protein
MLTAKLQSIETSATQPEPQRLLGIRHFPAQRLRDALRSSG